MTTRNPRKPNRPPTVLVANSWRSRQIPRYAADLRIRIALPDAPPRIVHARTSDLSTGGICIVLPQTVADDSIAVIGLRATSRQNVAAPDLTIWFRARLRHRSGFRCGYQFLDMTAEQRLFLRHLCLALPR
jgi:hypothetical protein